jgi:hypothetical protein
MALHVLAYIITRVMNVVGTSRKRAGERPEPHRGLFRDEKWKKVTRAGLNRSGHGFQMLWLERFCPTKTTAEENAVKSPTATAGY